MHSKSSIIPKILKQATNTIQNPYSFSYKHRNRTPCSLHFCSNLSFSPLFSGQAKHIWIILLKRQRGSDHWMLISRLHQFLLYPTLELSIHLLWRPLQRKTSRLKSWRVWLWFLMLGFFASLFAFNFWVFCKTIGVSSELI